MCENLKIKKKPKKSWNYCLIFSPSLMYHGESFTLDEWVYERVFCPFRKLGSVLSVDESMPNIYFQDCISR